MKKMDWRLMEKISCKKISSCLAVIKIPYFSFGGEVAFTNIFLIIDKELVLIDAGPWREDYVEMLSFALNQLGFKLEDMSRIIYTHAHPDHMGGGLELHKQTEISHSVYWEAREQVEQYSEYAKLVKSISRDTFSQHLSLHPAVKDTYFKLIDYFWMPTLGAIEIDNELYEGDLITTGKLKMRVVATPGHSPWDISLWEEEKAILFTGDFLLEKNTTLTGGINGFGSDLRSYDSSLRKIKGYLKKARFVFPAHGPSIKSCFDLADFPLRTIRNREERILRYLSSKKSSLMDLMMMLYSSKDKSALTLVRQLGIVLTHLEKLERESKVVRLQAKDEVIYELSQ